MDKVEETLESVSEGDGEEEDEVVEDEELENEYDEEGVDEENVVFGITKDDTRFVVPSTWDVIESFLQPKKLLELPVLFQIIYSAGLITCLSLRLLPQGVYIGMYVFWRLCYNCGLGYVLRGQSNYDSFTEFFREKIKFYPNRVRFFEWNISLKDSQTSEVVKYEMKDYNDYFNSWMVYRFLVDIVLGCDFISYLALCLSFFSIPEHIDYFDVIMYVLGFFLLVFNVYVKSQAHHVIGDYAWYWGDFFFQLQRNLIFDSVFMMFPHPMYTLGYSFYYGMSLVTRSYTVFYISFFGHMLQIFFLVFIEEPHIEKIYGSVVNIQAKKLKSLKEYFSKKDLFFFNHINFFNSSDLNLTIITGYLILLYLLSLHRWFYFGHVLFWRVFHTFFLGLILILQSRSKFWTQRFVNKKVAFENWKKLYNTSLTINYIVFGTAALKNLNMPEDWEMSKLLLNAFLSVCLISISIYSSFSIHETLGDFGWFYGDFFLDDEIKEKNLFYSGLYRYLNNPDLVLGCSIYYGLALFSHSVDVFLLAIFNHLCCYLFVNYVEEPHMRKIYGRENVRRVGGLGSESVKEGKKIVKGVKNLIKKLRKGKKGKGEK